MSNCPIQINIIQECVVHVYDTFDKKKRREEQISALSNFSVLPQFILGEVPCECCKCVVSVRN